jgi:hypothetical protein
LASTLEDRLVARRMEVAALETKSLDARVREGA